MSQTDVSLEQALNEQRNAYKSLRRARKYMIELGLVVEKDHVWWEIETMLDYHLKIEQLIMDAIMHQGNPTK